MEPLLRNRLGECYITGDLEDPRADVRLDITDIKYPDATFDVIYCSHVLEHVPEDRVAMRELRRVLKPNGWAILLVPVSGDHTYEDPSITDPAERLKAFGLEDHVRQYGRDFVDRLREAGFAVDVIEASDLYSDRQAIRMGLRGDVGEIYRCSAR